MDALRAVGTTFYHATLLTNSRTFSVGDSMNPTLIVRVDLGQTIRNDDVVYFNPLFCFKAEFFFALRLPDFPRRPGDYLLTITRTDNKKSSWGWNMRLALRICGPHDGRPGKGWVLATVTQADGRPQQHTRRLGPRMGNEPLRYPHVRVGARPEPDELARLLQAWKDPSRPLHPHFAHLSGRLPLTRALLLADPFQQHADLVLAHARTLPADAGQEFAQSLQAAHRRMRGTAQLHADVFVAALRVVGDAGGTTQRELMFDMVTQSAAACEARHRECCNELVLAAANLVRPAPSRSARGPQAQLARADAQLRAALEWAVADAKAVALKRALLIPTERYLELHGDHGALENVPVHASNVFRAMLLACAGVMIDRDPWMDDWGAKCAPDFASAPCFEAAVRAYWAHDSDSGVSFKWPQRLDCPLGHQCVRNRVVHLSIYRCAGGVAKACLASGADGGDAMRDMAEPYVAAYQQQLTRRKLTTVLINAVTADEPTAALACAVLGLDARRGRSVETIRGFFYDEDTFEVNEAHAEALFVHALDIMTPR